MTTFGERLAAAREARPTKDVTIILDEEINKERALLLAELEAADDEQRLGAKNAADEIRERLDALQQAAEEAGETLRFTRIPGRDWAALTSRNPVRIDSPIDRHYGYNIDAVTEAAARFRDKNGRAYGHRIENGEPVDISAEEWDDIYELQSGTEVTDIRDAIWALNEYEPQQRIQALVKASGAATRSVSK